MNKKWLFTLCGILLLAVGLPLFLKGQNFSWKELGEAFRSFSWQAILLAYLADCVQVGFMMLRQGILISGAGYPVSTKRVIRAVGTGQFINSVLPARTGDIARGIFLCEGEAPGKIPATAAAAVIVADKIIDLISFIILVLATRVFLMPEFEKYSPLKNWKGQLGLALLVVLIMVAIPFVRRRYPNAYAKFQEFRRGLRGVFRRKSFFFSVGAALLVWAAEAEAIRFLADAQGMALSWDRTFFMLCILNLFVAVPISVGNLGTFEAAIVMALSAIGHPATASVALALAHHLLQIASVSTWAGVSFLLGLRTHSRVSTNATHSVTKSTDSSGVDPR